MSFLYPSSTEVWSDVWLVLAIVAGGHLVLAVVALVPGALPRGASLHVSPLGHEPAHRLSQDREVEETPEHTTEKPIIHHTPFSVGAS